MNPLCPHWTQYFIYVRRSLPSNSWSNSGLPFPEAMREWPQWFCNWFGMSHALNLDWPKWKILYTMCCHFFHPFKLSYIRCKSHMFETALMWCWNMWELETPAHGHSSRPQSCWSHINLTPQIFRGCPLLWILWIVVPLPSTVNQNWGHSWNLCSK